MTNDIKCPLPWIHTSIHTTGRLRSCCIAQEEIEHDGDRLDVINHGFDEVISSSSMRDLRGSMRIGKKHPSCRTCWVDEANGKISKRLSEIEQAKGFGFEFDYDQEPTGYQDIQLGVGNICNLKCRTCSPFCSTKWIKEFQDRKEGTTATFNNLTTNKQTSDSRFWIDLDKWSKTVRRLEIMGGEPFYMKEFEILVDRLIENGESSHIHINGSSNGTIFKKSLNDKIMKNFKSFGVQFSIDGYGEHFDYLRHGNNWANVKNNLDNFYDLFLETHKFNMGITITISQINLYYIREMHQFITDNYPDPNPEKERTVNVFNNTIHYPSYYSNNCMPKEIKEQYKHKIINPEEYGLPAWDKHIFDTQIQPLLNHLDTPSKNSDWFAFVKETNAADRYRKENFSETFPELWELFEPYWKEE